MNKVRIVHITASMQMGGAEQCLFHLTRGLQSFDQTVITFRDGVFVQRIRELGVVVYVVPYGPLFLWRLFKMVRVLRPDVIHALLWASGAAARLIGRLLHIPVIYAIHSPVNSDGYNSWVRNMFDRLTIHWAQQIVFVSQRVRDQCSLSKNVRRAIVICNGVDGAYMRAQAQAHCAESEQCAQRCQIQDGHFVIGTVGRLVALKNQRLLLQVMARLYKRYPYVRLLVVGDGPLLAALQHEAQQLGLAKVVHWLRGDAADYYPLFDVFVLPSYIEGLSMALLEAMSYGLPVLAASATAQHDVLDGANGVLFAPDGLDELEAKLVRMLQDAAWRERLAMAGLATVQQKFLLKNAVAAYAAVFRQSAGKI